MKGGKEKSLAFLYYRIFFNVTLDLTSVQLLVPLSAWTVGAAYTSVADAMAEKLITWSTTGPPNVMPALTDSFWCYIQVVCVNWRSTERLIFITVNFVGSSMPSPSLMWWAVIFIYCSISCSSVKSDSILFGYLFVSAAWMQFEQEAKSRNLLVTLKLLRKQKRMT